jgi:hypothetical protein
MIPGTGYYLFVDNKFIPGYHRRKLRNKRGQRQLLRCIWQTHHSSDADVSHIDWDSPARAINTCQHKSRTFVVVTFLSKWLSVVKQVPRYNKAAYPS